MHVRDFFSHTSPDGRSPGDRIKAAGYGAWAWGENIAAGFETPAEVMAGWMRSEGHCRNVLGAAFSELGVGIVAPPGGGQVQWVQNFGRPSGTSAPSAGIDLDRACPAAGIVPAGTPAAPSVGRPVEAAGDGAAAPVAPKVRFRATFVGRKLRVSGRLSRGTARKVQVVLRRGGGARRATARVRHGAFRLVLAPPAGQGAVTVTVLAR
jgi:hypothetical protein